LQIEILNLPARPLLHLLPQVASYMRAVLRTLAQCHHHRILHRDIKPGNFMLLTEAEDAPVKALGKRVLQ
jgi:serine/threonine protein kinase